MIWMWLALACAPMSNGDGDDGGPTGVGDPILTDVAGDPLIDDRVESVAGWTADSSVLFSEDEIPVFELASATTPSMTSRMNPTSTPGRPSSGRGRSTAPSGCAPRARTLASLPREVLAQAGLQAL